MLTDLLRIITPDALAAAMRNNPKVVQATFQKFDAYASLGKALTVSQQVCISSNLDKLHSFFGTDSGKAAVSVLAEEFVRYVK